MKYKNHNGFTLVEVIFVTVILSVALLGMFQLFILCSVQSELAGNKTSAVVAAQDKIEEIRQHTYSLIATDYASGGTPGNKFDLSYMTGKGVVYIDSSNPELLGIEVEVSWRNKQGRIVGEDTNLNGVLDSGEDTDSDGKIDSPVTLMSMITRR